MKNLITTLLFLSFLTVTPAIAGTGHSHGEEEAITSEQATSLASEKIKQLIDAGKIDTTWKEVKVSSIEQKTYSHDPEWVVKFTNNKISDASKQTLYMFFSLGGRYLATNYTGE